jgi:predicted DNA-binding protein (MmcQ/YjbR family)
MTARDFRHLALGMEGAVEAAHMNHPDFRVNGKIFATIHADDAQGMVKLTPEQQERFIREHPAMFHLAAGAWGRQGNTMVTFAHATDEVVGEAMTLAWQNLARAAKNESGIRRAKAARIRTHSKVVRRSSP